MARIIHPEPTPGAQSFIGIDFVDGVAEVDLDTMGRFTVESLVQHRFTIELEPIIDLTKLKLPELRDIASVEGIDVGPKATKAELIEAISRVPALPTLGGGEQVGQFAIIELADGTVIGDGKTIAALPVDESAPTEV